MIALALQNQRTYHGSDIDSVNFRWEKERKHGAVASRFGKELNAIHSEGQNKHLISSWKHKKCDVRAKKRVVNEKSLSFRRNSMLILFIQNLFERATGTASLPCVERIEFEKN